MTVLGSRMLTAGVVFVAAAVLTTSGSAASSGVRVRTSSTVHSVRSSSSQPTVHLGAIAGTVKSAYTVGVPHFDHVVVVMLENHPYGELFGTASTPFLTHLANSGAVMTHSYAVTHPSEPNYLALFSGSIHGLSSDACPLAFNPPDLASALLAAHYTFVGYSESLPWAGYAGCTSGPYARKHSPWVDFPLPASVNQPMTAFPADLTLLPSLSFVIPNLNHDMHDGTIAQGDQWLSLHLGTYASWAATHNSLLIVTTDEDDRNHGNHITTILTGAHVKVGQDGSYITHYNVLRTLLASFHLASFGAASTRQPITTIWEP